MSTRSNDSATPASFAVPIDQEALDQSRDARPVWAAFLLCSLLFLPGALGFLFQGLSFATGTSLVSVAAIALLLSGQISTPARVMQNTMVAISVIVFAILCHLVAAYVVDGDPQFDLGRAFLSLLLMAVILLVVPIVADGIMDVGDRLGLVVKVTCGLFVLIALLSFLQIQPPIPVTGSKPTFPYTEPSFLGFSMPAVLIFTMARSAVPIRVAVLGVFLALGYLLSNFTIIAACALAAIVTLPLSWFAAGVGVILASLASLDLTYYTERLDFDWANSTNLSSLVYVQGWQMLQEALSRSFGLGVGFQQLGIVYTNVPASYRINMILGYDLNLQDGGFIFSKIVSEFGIVGLCIVASYLYVAAKSFIALRTLLLRPALSSSVSDGEVFAMACVTGYVIELMVRGTNYFTGTFVLMLAGALYIMRRKQIPMQSKTLEAMA